MRISSLGNLSAKQWLWLGQAWLLLWQVSYRLRHDHSNWLIGKLSELSNDSACPASLKIAVAMHESVRLAERCHPWSAACLPKSLVLAKLLQGKGVAAQVRLGVSKGGHAEQQNSANRTGLASHAWVEVGGVPVCEPTTIYEDFSLVDASLGGS